MDGVSVVVVIVELKVTVLVVCSVVVEGSVEEVGLGPSVVTITGSQSFKLSGINSSNGVESEHVPPETAASKFLLSRISHEIPQSQIMGSIERKDNLVSSINYTIQENYSRLFLDDQC